VPFAALQGACLRCAAGDVLDSCTKSSDFPGTETENRKNLCKRYFRICNFLSAVFFLPVLPASCVAPADKILHSQSSNVEITALLQLKHKLYLQLTVQGCSDLTRDASEI